MNGFQNMRERADITQDELSKRLGIDRSTVAKWETGKSFPRPGLLIRLTEIFGCTADELLGIGRPQPKPESDHAEETA